MKRISAIATPDRPTIDAAHGPLYHVKEAVDKGLDFAYNTARDKAEQAIARRVATDPAFAEQFKDMTFEQWEQYLDEHCGKRPGRGKWYNRYNKSRQKHGGARETPIPEGFIGMAEAAKLGGWTRRQIDWYAKAGVRRHGQHARLQSEKVGKNRITRAEWVEEFKRAAWWLAIDAAVKNQKGCVA